MVKPVATNMTITLQQQGQSITTVKPLVVGEQVVVHTNATPAPILPHQPVAAEQDQNPKQPQHVSLEEMAGLNLERTGADRTRLRDFNQEQIDLLSNRYALRERSSDGK